MQNQDKGKFDIKKINPLTLIIIVFLFFSNPLFAFFILISYLSLDKNGKNLNKRIRDALSQGGFKTALMGLESAIPAASSPAGSAQGSARRSQTGALEGLMGFSGLRTAGRKLKKGNKYLQISFNGNLAEAEAIIRSIPSSEKIIFEAGTPLIKSYGMSGIRRIRSLSPGAYIVADMKTADLSEREVEMCARAGANAVVCLGVAPVEVIDAFVAACGKYGVEAMVDMMNVPSAIMVLKKLRKLPRVVMLHRGVDETEGGSGKQIPFYQIKQVKGMSGCLVAVAGGDSAREVQSAVFNDADIVVVWKDFMSKGEGMGQIIAAFLKEIK